MERAAQDLLKLLGSDQSPSRGMRKSHKVVMPWLVNLSFFSLSPSFPLYFKSYSYKFRIIVKLCQAGVQFFVAH